MGTVDPTGNGRRAKGLPPCVSTTVWGKRQKLHFDTMPPQFTGEPVFLERKVRVDPLRECLSL